MDERYTVAGMLRALSAEQPDRVMLVDGSVRRTWAEQHRQACRVAGALAAEGVGPGDRVAFIDHNGLAFFDLLFGGAYLGAVNVALNWRLAPAEMAAIIEDARASVLVLHPEYLGHLEKMAGDLSTVRRVVVLGDEPAGTPDAPGVTYDDWLAGVPERDPGFTGGPDAVCLQLYTSGTTGLPKGVMLTNGNLAAAIGNSVESFGIGHETVSLVAMPLFHIGGTGWALCAMSRGGTSVIVRDVDPLEILELVERERVTRSFVVPAVLMFLLATPAISTTDLSSLDTLFYGASPIAEDVLVQCLETFGCGFAQLYGMTETTGAITLLPPEDHDPDGPRRHLLRSAGRPLEGVELRILDPVTGDEATTGAVGEVCTRSMVNMAGYWDKPEETAKTIDASGWLHTGDAGYIDAEGYLFLHDRIKDMVISGGENIYPAEVENVLLAHPGVVDAAVIGVPDERWGEAVKGVVVAAPGVTLDEPEVIAFCRERLAHFKCPKSVVVTDALPRNPSGKIVKRELRERYRANAG